VDNIVNEDYNYNKGQCKKDPTQPRCFLYYYFDEDGIIVYTDERQTCSSEPVCESDLPSCPVGEVCEATTSCGEAQDICPDDLAVNQYCEDATSCEAVDNCEGLFEENQQCTTIPGGDGDFDPSTDNPYDYANMECLDANGDPAWYFTDGSNPRYVKGLCAGSALNLSGNTILTGESCTDAEACFLAFPFNDYFDDLNMEDSDPISKILTWEQYGPDFGTTATNTDETNFDDPSWENPYDVAKGHRGFMAGDMVMLMYAWSHNWKALTDAHDVFNLYNRRSFDGGLTWTTLPASFTHTNDITYTGDGTTTCEFMDQADSTDEIAVCTPYGPGEFEQARNVSQLVGSQVTVLDPRYAPTSRSITAASVSTDSLPEGFSWGECTGTEDEVCDDTRDPSRYFMVYETGHSSAYDAGEAPPLDLFYSRAVDWGDDYLVWAETAEDCLETVEGFPAFCNEFDAIEGSQFDESGEASVTTSPGGQFFYSVWNQIDLDQAGNEEGSDAWFRRILFLDDYISEETSE
jgi:hypothetical protein